MSANMKQFVEYCEAYDQTGSKEFRDEAIRIYWMLTGTTLAADEFEDRYLDLMYENW